MKVLALLFCLFLISGCAKKSDNQYVNVGEKTTTEEIIYEYNENHTEEETENDYSIDKEDVKNYIDDSHFYDDEEVMDFAPDDAVFYDNISGLDENEYKKMNKEILHIKVLETYICDDTEKLGEYFNTESVKKKLQEQREFWKSMDGNDEFSYMCVKIELTNNYKETMKLCVANFLHVYTRIYDERGKEFNIADKYIYPAMASTEFRYDSQNKVNEKSDYYYVQLSAGETTTLTCVYLMRNEYLDDELYFGLHIDEGEYNAKYKCVFPPTAETTKFLKINLNEQK